MKVINVIKIGGNVVDDSSNLHEFLQHFADLKGLKILVHGGGKIATKIAESLQLETTMVQGRRVTDDQMLEVVTMTYGGLVNKELVSKLQALNCNALGLTGADGNLITAQKRAITNGVDYGWVGDPVKVNKAFLADLLKVGAVPVVAPLTHDGSGQLLNTNADTIAQTLGVALSDTYDVFLNYCFELPGVLLDINQPDSLIKTLDRKSYLEHKAAGRIGDGMIPKLENAFQAVDGGVKAIRILHHSAIANLENNGDDVGTTIH